MYYLEWTSKWNLGGQGLNLQMDFLFTIYDPKASEY